MSAPRAPAGLAASGRRLWRDVTGEFELSGEALAMLREACHVADSVARLQEAAAGEPAVITTRLGGRAANPVHTELRAERRLLLALLLGLREPVTEAGEVPAPGRLSVVR